MDKTYTKEQIQYAVDVATGDDGFRGEEVIGILETFYDWVWCKTYVWRAG